jgi:hypothetical protein
LRVGIRIIIVIIIVTDMCPHPLTHVSRNQEKNTAAPLRISRTFVTLIAIIIPKSMIFDGRSGLYLKLNLIS